MAAVIEMYARFVGPILISYPNPTHNRKVNIHAVF